MHQIWTKQTDIADYTEHSQLGAMVQLQLERAAATDVCTLAIRINDLDGWLPPITECSGDSAKPMKRRAASAAKDLAGSGSAR